MNLMLSLLLVCEPLSMCWQKPEGQFSFEVAETGSAFEIRDEEGKVVFSHPREIVTEEKTGSYTIHERLILPDETPQHLWAIEDLVRCIKSKRVVFYSGAGLSAAAGIPTMTGLTALFQMHLSWEEWVDRAIASPSEIIEKAERFQKLCIGSDPTLAHHALRYICQKGEIPLWTENLDLLHQKSGIDPLVVSSGRLIEEVTVEELKDIDAIICLGLSFDDKGALGWYKHHNPSGQIISIDLMSPVYLGREDALLKGDLQEVLPILLRKLR